MIIPQTFEDLAAYSFSFLGKDFGYSRSPSSQEFLVRYRRGNVWVDVVYDPHRSHELGVLVGREGDVSPAYGLDEVLRFCGCPEEEVRKIDLVQTVDEEVLKGHLVKSANLLRVYGALILRGEAASFTGLHQWRARNAAEYTNKIILQQLERSVEAAWECKNYCEVVRLLAPNRNKLDRKLLRRLSFAESKQ
jgi:hypothetical protein